METFTKYAVEIQKAFVIDTLKRCVLHLISILREESEGHCSASTTLPHTPICKASGAISLPYHRRLLPISPESWWTTVTPALHWLCKVFPAFPAALSLPWNSFHFTPGHSLWILILCLIDQSHVNSNESYCVIKLEWNIAVGKQHCCTTDYYKSTWYYFPHYSSNIEAHRERDGKRKRMSQLWTFLATVSHHPQQMQLCLCPSLCLIHISLSVPLTTWYWVLAFSSALTNTHNEI